jgi:hypothetical protein
MLGLAPTPNGATIAASDVYSARINGALLAGLGLSALLLLALVPATFGAGWLLAALVGVPLAAAGLFGVLIGYVGLSTRIEIAPEGLTVSAPGWRACPFPPVREVQIGWQDLCAIRHRTEIYRLGPLPFRLPLEVYAIDTSRGRLLFGSYYLWELDAVLIDLTNRADCPWHEDGTVEAGLLHTLRHGPPLWSSA